MAQTFKVPHRRLPWRVIGLRGYSTAGKDTLVKTLREHGYAVTGLSAGHHNKVQLEAMGVPREAVWTNSPLRDVPSELLPMDPRTGVNYTPRAYEILVINNPKTWMRHAVLSEATIVRLLAQPGSGTVILNGYRGLAMHMMLRRLQARLGREAVLLVNLKSPQVPKGLRGAGFDDCRCDGQQFDLVVRNDKRNHPKRMVQQLLAAAR